MRSFLEFVVWFAFGYWVLGELLIGRIIFPLLGIRIR